MWNDSVIEAIRIASVNTLDLRDIELGCYPMQTNSERLDAIDNILRTIKHLDPAVRSTRVQAIQSRVGSLPDDLMLTDQQIQSLATSGVVIGAHTVNHPILASISNDAAHGEIQASKSYLEALLQQPVEVFAYPNGKPGQDYAEEHSAMVRALGFKAAVSTHWGVSTRSSDRYQLPRFTPWDRQELKFALRLLASYKDVDPLLQNSR
jgi:peptidoglycan/xylan/chitin deacetylase (PgdA/CDA1 family)